MAAGKSVSLEEARWDAALTADWHEGTLLPARPLSLEWQGSKTWLLIKEGIHIILDRILLKDPAHLSSKCPLYSRLSRVEKRALVLRYASALVLRTPLRRDVLVDTVTMCVFEACEQEAVLEAPADGKRKPRQPFMQKVMGEALQELLAGRGDEQDQDVISALLQHKATDLVITDAVDRMREVWMSEQVAGFFDRLSEGDKPPPVIHCPEVAASFGIDYFLPPPPELTASDERSLNEAIRADEDDAGKETVFAANLKKAQRLARQQRQKGKRLQQQLRGALESSGPVAAAAAAAAAEAAGLSHEAADASAAAVSGLTASASVSAESGDSGAGACTAPSVPAHSALLQSSVGAALRSLRLGSTGTAGAAREGVEAGTRADSAAAAEAIVKAAAAHTDSEDAARLGHPSGSGAGVDEDSKAAGAGSDGEDASATGTESAEASDTARRKRSYLRHERQLALLRQHEQELRASQASQLAVASVAGRGSGDWWWTQGWVGRYCRAVGRSSSASPSAAASGSAAVSGSAVSSDDESDAASTALAAAAIGSMAGFDSTETSAKSHASPAVVSALSAAHKLGPVADALAAEAAWPSVNGLTAAATEAVNPHARVLRALAEDPLQWATAWSGMRSSLRAGVAALSAAEVCDVIDSQPLWLSLRGMVGCNLWRDGVWPIISNDGHLTWVRFAKSNAERFWFLDGGDALALVPMFLAWSQTVVVSARSELDAIGEALTDQRPEDVSRGVQTHLENAVAAALLVKIADYALQMSEAARASSVSRRILAEWNEEEEAARERERVREEREAARRAKLAEQQKADAEARRARQALEAAAEASRLEKEEEERARKQTAAAAAAAARLEAEEAAARQLMRQQEAQASSASVDGSGGLGGFGTGHLSPPRAAASMGLGEASLGDSLLGGGGVGMGGLGGLGGLDDSSGGLVGMGGIGVGSLTGGFTLADDGSSSAGDAGTSGSNTAGADAAEASLNMSLSFLSD